jgi:hypothetical protein
MGLTVLFADLLEQAHRFKILSACMILSFRKENEYRKNDPPLEFFKAEKNITD